MKLIIAAALVVGAVGAFYLLAEWSPALRFGTVIVGAVGGAALTLTTELGRDVIAFARGANIERQKMVWPARREAAQVTGLVLVMVVLFGLYLWLLDSISFYGIYTLLLGLKS